MCVLIYIFRNIKHHPNTLDLHILVRILSAQVTSKYFLYPPFTRLLYCISGRKFIYNTYVGG